MKWSEFVQRKEAYKKTWALLKAEYAPENPVRKFLDKAYMNIFFNGKQIDFNLDPYTIARDTPDFFVKNKYFNEYLELIKTCKALEDLSYKEKKTKVTNEFDHNGTIRKKVSRLDMKKKELQQFDVNQLEVVPNRAEMIVSTIDMDIIQNIKGSKFCDQEATLMSRASIRVILVGGDKLGYPW